MDKTKVHGERAIAWIMNASIYSIHNIRENPRSQFPKTLSRYMVHLYTRTQASTDKYDLVAYKVLRNDQNQKQFMFRQ